MKNKFSPLKIAKQGLKQSRNIIGRIHQTASVAGLGALRVAKGDPMDAMLLRESFEQLGVTYIKLGQFIASTPSIFPKEYVLAFQDCLDQTTPIAFEQIYQVIQRELAQIGQSIDGVFSHIEPKPVACASIAQVHRATLKDGRQVAIKVQKPNVGTVMQTDLTVLHSVFWVMEKAMPSLKAVNLAPIVDEIRTRMLAETDFIAESEHIERFLSHLAKMGNGKVTAPTVHHNLSTGKMLVMDFLVGKSLIDIDDNKQLDPQAKKQLMSDVLDTWFLSLMVTGEFHADLHAGNLMLLNDGRIAFLDFGLMGKIDPKSLQACFSLVQSLQANDYHGMANAMVKIGMTHQADKININRLAMDLQSILGKMTPQHDASSTQTGNDGLNAMMLEMVEIGKRHGIHFPRDFALLVKQLLYFDRFMVTLAPEMDLFEGDRLALLHL